MRQVVNITSPEHFVAGEHYHVTYNTIGGLMECQTMKFEELVLGDVLQLSFTVPVKDTSKRVGVLLLWKALIRAKFANKRPK